MIYLVPLKKWWIHTLVARDELRQESATESLVTSVSLLLTSSTRERRVIVATTTRLLRSVNVESIDATPRAL